MSDDLVKRLRDCAFTGVSNQRVVHVGTALLTQSADRIEALEARVAAADALADALTAYNRGGAGPLTGWLDVDQSLAAYRKAQEGEQ